MRYKTTTANRGCGDMTLQGCAGCASSIGGGCCVSDGSAEGCEGCSGCDIRGCGPKTSFDWLSDIPESRNVTDMVEVEFKNGRKGYYLNADRLELYKGSIVAVDSGTNMGYDMGTVSLVGKLVEMAIRKNRYRPEKDGTILRIYREATPSDLRIWKEAKSREHDTMIRSRQIASELGLDMKIGDVEYQGDGNKAIFYYIADGRVDFRQLIRILADRFGVRIEMRQIGARQEAGRIGGIGPCGQQLCCSSWMSNFTSVNTTAARIQDLSLNPQKLTGMCGKIKCCMNFEVQTYAEALKHLPNKDTILETQEATYYHFKTDTFQRMISYSRTQYGATGVITIPADRVFEIISMNSRGERPLSLLYDQMEEVPKEKSADILSDNSLTRFDSKRSRKKKWADKSETKPAYPEGELIAKGQSRPYNPPRRRGRRTPQQTPQSQPTKL